MDLRHIEIVNGPKGSYCSGKTLGGQLYYLQKNGDWAPILAYFDSEQQIKTLLNKKEVDRVESERLQEEQRLEERRRKRRDEEEEERRRVEERRREDESSSSFDSLLGGLGGGLMGGGNDYGGGGGDFGGGGAGGDW
jgi:uncharacterized membrane protein YgcG